VSGGTSGGGAAGLPRRGRRMVLFWLAVCIVVLLDQASKAVVRRFLVVGGVPVAGIPGLVEIVRVENTGAAFGIGAGATAVFAAIACVIFAAAFAWVLMEDLPLSLSVFVGVVAGGGVGNLIDRVTRGAVTDFLSLVPVSFPVFNVADMAVTCGVAAVLVTYFWWERSGRRAPEGTSPVASDGALEEDGAVEGANEYD